MQTRYPQPEDLLMLIRDSPSADLFLSMRNKKRLYTVARAKSRSAKPQQNPSRIWNIAVARHLVFQHRYTRACLLPSHLRRGWHSVALSERDKATRTQASCTKTCRSERLPKYMQHAKNYRHQGTQSISAALHAQFTLCRFAPSASSLIGPTTCWRVCGFGDLYHSANERALRSSAS